MQLADFLQAHADRLAADLHARLRPFYEPQRDTDPAVMERLAGLPRRLYPVQAELAACAARAFATGAQPRLFLCGEQGCGKTTIALATLALAPRPQRALVVCPSHLVEKWLREAKAVVPEVVTVDLAVRQVISLLDEFRQRRTRPAQPEVYVISKDRLKLSYGWRAAYWAKGRFGVPHCPDCGSRVVEHDEWLSDAQLRAKRRTCGTCGAALWQADPALKRMAPVEYLKRRLKGFFDLVILDEIHEYKGGDTLQGQAMGSVLGLAPRALCLTGTLTGGYADDLFYLLWRIAPAALRQDGFTYRGAADWLQRYGVLEIERDLEDGEDHRYGRGRKRRGVIRRRPGVAPVAIARYLLDKTAFIRVRDVLDGLPPYEERAVLVPMSDEQRAAYRRLECELREALRAAGTRVLGAMLQALLSYPDSCVLFEERIPIRDRDGEVVQEVSAPRLPDQGVLPKEQALLDLVGLERHVGRKVLVYVQFTHVRDLRPRLKRILEDGGYRVGVLDAAVEPKRREAWIAKHQDALDVLLVQPELVKTGLDLYVFPTVVFYQIGYNLFTLRQAARRSWRIGQAHPVSVRFLAYEQTLQATALTLMAEKLKTALLVEGDLPEGLAEYGAAQASILEELGRALLEGRSLAGAEAAWAEVRRQEAAAEQELLPAGPAERASARLLVAVAARRRRGTRGTLLEVVPEQLDELLQDHGPVQLAFC